ncbi:MAG: hypothetical protein KGJ84_11685 [Elusimicrobia bacterium]|nr:hypothetical protein [Elusimicrobiota bacterium]
MTALMRDPDWTSASPAGTFATFSRAGAAPNPAFAKVFKARAAPTREVMQAVAANMGVPLKTMPKGVRLAGRNSLGRDIEAGGVLPNPGKALDDGTITGTGAHLLRDGSPHMVSVADRLTGGAVLLMTGYADAHRVKKTLSGVMYEFEQVADAARIPPTREVFTDVLTQGETVVPQAEGADMILAELDAMPHNGTMRVEISSEADVHIRR